MYRANRNAQAFSRGLESTPPGAVYWYFVPFANLWKPFEAMNETWRVSHEPGNFRRAFTPNVLRLWWTLWLFGSAIGHASGRMGWKARTTGVLFTASVLEIVSSLLLAATALVLIRVVRQVSARQTALIEQGWTRPPSGAWARPAENGSV
jgi:hypothetical protein